MATDRKIPMITGERLLGVEESPMASVLSGAEILNRATTNVAPEKLKHH